MCSARQHLVCANLTRVAWGASHVSSDSSHAGCVTPDHFFFASYCLFFYLVSGGKAQGCGLRDMHQENNNNQGSFVAVKSAHKSSFFILF